MMLIYSFTVNNICYKYFSNCRGCFTFTFGALRFHLDNVLCCELWLWSIMSWECGEWQDRRAKDAEVIFVDEVEENLGYYLRYWSPMITEGNIFFVNNLLHTCSVTRHRYFLSNQGWKYLEWKSARKLNCFIWWYKHCVGVCRGYMSDVKYVWCSSPYCTNVYLVCASVLCIVFDVDGMTIILLHPIWDSIILNTALCSCCCVKFLMCLF